MSRLTEFLSLLPKGLHNADKVLEGMINQIKNEYKQLPEDQQEEILRRQLICQECPFNSINATTSKEYKELTGKHYETDRKGLHCSFCGCPMKTKISSLSSDCGITDYNEEFPNNKQPLKWEAYNNTK